MADLLRPGQTVQIALAGENTASALATVLRASDDTFYVSPPMRDGKKISVSGAYIGVRLALADAIYTMRCRVQAIESTGVRLTVPEAKDIQRVQRREFARSATDLPCEIAVADEAGELGESVRAQLVDLSGGGASVMHTQIIPSDRAVKLVFDLPENGSVVVQGVTVRVRVLKSLTTTRYCAGVRFNEIDERTRSRIIRYVFSMQRELTRFGKHFK